MKSCISKIQPGDITCEGKDRFLVSKVCLDGDKCEMSHTGWHFHYSQLPVAVNAYLYTSSLDHSGWIEKIVKASK